MTQINAFKCDSCKQEVNAKWNGEHFLPPVGWVDITEVVNLEKRGHLCDICIEVAFSMHMRGTNMGKRLIKQKR